MSSVAHPRSGLLAGGNWIVDHVKTLDTWPPQDSLANILSETWGNGGSPYNILKNLARMGANFPLAGVGLVGADADGDRILADCRDHHILTPQLRRATAVPTSYSDVMTVRATGRRTFFHQRGANAHLGPEHFDFANTEAKIFHLGYLLLLDRLDQPDPDNDGRPRACALLDAARAEGLLTSIDCVSENSDRFLEIVRPALRSVDYLFVNDFEAEKITGLKLRRGSKSTIHRATVESAARALLDHGVHHWVILHFPEAAYVLSPAGGGHWQPSLNIPESVIQGTAGAGDAFASGVLYGLHEGWSMPDALRLGVCAGASCLMDATCSGGVRPVLDCLALAETYGWQELPS